MNHGLNIIFSARKKFTLQSYCPLPKKPYVISSPYPIVRVIFLSCLYPILWCNYHILLLCVYPIISRAYPNARTSSRMYIVRLSYSMRLCVHHIVSCSQPIVCNIISYPACINSIIWFGFCRGLHVNQSNLF